MGYIGYAVLFTIILCLLMIVLAKVNFGISKNKDLNLRITIPENMNYEETFDDLLNKYTSSWELARVKTKEFGALFELSYRIKMDGASQKEFLDEIRTRNGNLTISLTMADYSDKAYV